MRSEESIRSLEAGAVTGIGELLEVGAGNPDSCLLTEQ